MDIRNLYKAKRLDNGEWVQGYLSYPFCTKKGNESYYFYAKDSLGFFCRCVVDASTICQCTGLKDKNGNLIWENDIVKYHFGNVYAQIRYGAYQSCFDSQKTEHIGFYVDWSESRNYRKDLGYWIHMVNAEVVGNVFDNLELLESEG